MVGWVGVVGWVGRLNECGDFQNKSGRLHGVGDLSTIPRENFRFGTLRPPRGGGGFNILIFPPKIIMFIY